jgi:SH3 domain-containing protein
MNGHYGSATPTNVPPPAYGHAPPPPAPSAPILTHAVALYAYNATDAGDLSLLANDRVAVTEYMNAEWWKGRNERTGAEGIFPASYVRVEEQKNFGPPPSSYGNMPMDVAQNAQPQGDGGPPKKGTAQKIGGKLGNAALFGAGGMIFIHLVRLLERSKTLIRIYSYNWKQYCQLYLLRRCRCRLAWFSMLLEESFFSQNLEADWYGSTIDFYVCGRYIGLLNTRAKLKLVTLHFVYTGH